MRIILSILLCGLISCDSPSVTIDENQLKKELLKANQLKSQEESDSISSYITHHGWQMIQTKTGLSYEVLATKNGPFVKLGEMVSIFYKVYLLDGTLCYDNTLTHPVKFKVGEDHVEAGLHELMPLVRVGDELRVILPSHLAFGFTGDGKKIPGDSPVLYEIKVVTVQ